MKHPAAVLPIILLALGACEPRGGEVAGEPRKAITTVEPEPQPTTASPEPAATQAVLPPGEYRLVGADGAAVDLPHAITVSITDDTIALVSQCVTPRWNYTYADQRLTTRSIPDPICERGRYPAEEAAIAVFGSPETIRRTPENGWYLAGGGHSITLFSQ